MRHKLTVECQRCGGSQQVERAGRYRDEDYLELWHTYQALDAEHKRAIAHLTRKLADARERIEQLRALVQLLEVPALQPEPEYHPFA